MADDRGDRAEHPDGTEDLARALIPCLLAWVVPGAGHFYLGRRRRAVAFFCIVVVTFLLGLALNGRAYLADPEHPLTYLATFTNVALGPLDLVQREATYDQLVWRLPPGPRRGVLLSRMRQKVNSPNNEYGTTFLLTAALMNILLILDAFDIATGRKSTALQEDAE